MLSPTEPRDSTTTMQDHLPGHRTLILLVLREALVYDGYKLARWGRHIGAPLLAGRCLHMFDDPGSYSPIPQARIKTSRMALVTPGRKAFAIRIRRLLTRSLLLLPRRLRITVGEGETGLGVITANLWANRSMQAVCDTRSVFFSWSLSYSRPLSYDRAPRLFFGNDLFSRRFRRDLHTSGLPVKITAT